MDPGNPSVKWSTGSADAVLMSGLYAAAFLAGLAIYLFVSAARAKAGTASPKSPVLRAPGGEYRAEPVPLT